MHPLRSDLHALLAFAASGGLKNPPAPRPRAAGVAPAASSAVARPRPRPRPRPPGGVSGTLIFGPSSVAHTESGSGVPTVALYFVARPIGGPVKIAPLG